MKTRYITNEYRVTYLPDGSLQYDRLLNGVWSLFSFEPTDAGIHAESDMAFTLGVK